MTTKQTYNNSRKANSFAAFQSFGTFLSDNRITLSVGRKRNATNWGYSSIASTPDWLYRGYTGHEHYGEFALINMNGRMYDPTIGRMLSADNYVQNGASTQAYNRYTYAANNPLKYTDPSGEFIVALGAYLGVGLISHFSGNKSSKVFKHAATAALIVGTAGLGNSIATSGIAFANTTSIVASSIAYSAGQSVLTAGKSDITISFGAGSYNITQNEFGYLGKKGNSGLENFGYGLGALANVSDIYAFSKGAYGKNVEEEFRLITKNDAEGHIAIVDKNGKNIVSVGPDPAYPLPSSNKEFLTKDFPGTNNWYNYLDDEGFNKYTVSKISLPNLNTSKVKSFVSTNLSAFDYSVFQSCGYSCAQAASKALLAGGMLNIPAYHPVLIQAQIAAIRYSYISPFFVEYDR